MGCKEVHRRLYGLPRYYAEKVWRWWHWEWVKRVIHGETMELIYADGSRSGRTVARLAGEYFRAEWTIKHQTPIAVMFRAPRQFKGERALAVGRAPKGGLRPGDVYVCRYRVKLEWNPEEKEAVHG